MNLCGLVLFASCTWIITSLVWREPHAATTSSTLNTLFPYLVTSVRETCYNINYTEDLTTFCTCIVWCTQSTAPSYAISWPPLPQLLVTKKQKNIDALHSCFLYNNYTVWYPSWLQLFIIIPFGVAVILRHHYRDSCCIISVTTLRSKCQALLSKHWA